MLELFNCHLCSHVVEISQVHLSLVIARRHISEVDFLVQNSYSLSDPYSMMFLEEP